MRDPCCPMRSATDPDRTISSDHRRELGAFLRSRRARLRPEDVGLGGWGMRRVPGLRREEVAQLANVAMYRAAMTLHLDDPAWTELPEELAQRSADFAHYWSRGDVAGPKRRIKRFRHPGAGEMTLQSTSLLLADDPAVRLVILYPSGPADAAKLEQ